MRIVSKYQKDAAPPLIARWESHAERSNIDEAQVQLTYDVLLMLRSIRLLLLIVLVVVPVIAVIALAVLGGSADTGSTF